MNKISLSFAILFACLFVSIEVNVYTLLLMKNQTHQNQTTYNNAGTQEEFEKTIAQTPQDASVIVSKKNQQKVTIPAPIYKPTATADQLAGMKTAAWIYPGNPACGASTEYTDGRKIDILKAEFFTVTGGILKLLDESNTLCNGYSDFTIAKMKQYSTEQYVTISSADSNDMETFLAHTQTASSTDIATIVAFITTNNLTGVELDFEDFSSWSPDAYKSYKTFVTTLGTQLHAAGKKLILDGPAVSNNSEESWFIWRYSDFVTLPVDSIVVMAYDYQYDYGAGSPITPLDWLHSVIVWTADKYPKEKLTIGIPSYGYQGTKGTYRITILTNQQISKKVGYNTATRDYRSGEMTWQSGTNVYFFQDSVSMQQKRDVVASLGITSLSVWHLGGNPWF